MKSFARLAVALCALALAVPAAAQQSTARPTIGFGVSITPNDAFEGVIPTVELYLPLRIAPNFRLEPSLGVLSSNDGNDRRDITLGVGAFYVAPVSGPVDLYFGGRLKLNFAHVETTVGGVTNSDSDTDIAIAGALGSEYYLASHFSIGLEGQLGYYSHGNVSGDDDGFYTAGLGFLRMYFK